MNLVRNSHMYCFAMKLVLRGISGNYNSEETSFKIGILERIIRIFDNYKMEKALLVWWIRNGNVWEHLWILLSKSRWHYLCSLCRKLRWVLCRTKICFTFESIPAQISALCLDYEFDNSAYCAHVLPCKNEAVISSYVIQPLWADFSAEHSQEK